MEGNEVHFCRLLAFFIYFTQLFVQVFSSQLATTNDITLTLDGTLYFEVIEPQSISYTYKLKPSTDFGVPFTSMLRYVDLIIAEPYEACSPITNYIRNSVVMVSRGHCSFLTKTYNVEKAGGVAAIITDNNTDNDNVLIDMISDETKRETSIPSLFLLGKDGAMIRKELERLELDKAIINIPINITGVLPNRANKPPWTLW
ncbi:hypothetical protein SNE40_012800 [Patella caerulea]|uniref:PA domain-containing protein n=1 Tax=Patella caerulea TaxID=87958 RepID=A0AAN8JLP9_PATCE